MDGRVVEGSSAVDEAPVTGESVPVEKGPGDVVYSGSLNGQGGLLVEATKRAGDSTLQRIARLVEEAQASKAPAEQFVDRFSRVYTPWWWPWLSCLPSCRPYSAAASASGSTGRWRS